MSRGFAKECVLVPREPLVYIPGDKDSLLAAIKAEAVRRIIDSNTRSPTERIKRTVVIRQLDRWEATYARERTYDELVLTEMAEDVELTPEYMTATGFCMGEMLGNETMDTVNEVSSVYVKSVTIKEEEVREMKRSKNKKTVNAGRRISRFCTAEPPARVPARSRRTGRRVYIHHFGRYKNGASNRRMSERRWGNMRPKENPWHAATVLAGGRSRIRYYKMADYTHLTGSEWCEVYVSSAASSTPLADPQAWDELVFSVIFSNPCHPNSAWPGGNPPHPPLVPGQDNAYTGLLAEILHANLPMLKKQYVRYMLKAFPLLDIASVLLQTDNMDVIFERWIFGKIYGKRRVRMHLTRSFELLLLV